MIFCYLRTITYGDKREVVPMPLLLLNMERSPKIESGFLLINCFIDTNIGLFNTYLLHQSLNKKYSCSADIYLTICLIVD